MRKYTWASNDEVEFVVYAEDIDKAKEKAIELQRESREGNNGLYITRVEELYEP